MTVSSVFTPTPNNDTASNPPQLQILPTIYNSRSKMWFPLPWSDGKTSPLASVPASPSKVQPAHSGPQRLTKVVCDRCRRLSDSSTPSFAARPLESIGLCTPCKLREDLWKATLVWEGAQDGLPVGGIDRYHASKQWWRARKALANHLGKVDGTDGCSPEEQSGCIEMARLEAAIVEADLAGKKEDVVKAYRLKTAARKARAESRANAFANFLAAGNRRWRRFTLEGAGSDRGANMETGTLHVKDTTGLSTPEQQGNDTTCPAEISLTVNLDPSTPLGTIPKRPNTTGTTASIFPNLAFDSATPSTNNKILRAVRFHPTAAVQDTPVPYSYAHRAEAGYRNLECYNRLCKEYEPGQWATKPFASSSISGDSTSEERGKKRQREDDEDAYQDGCGGSSDWQYAGKVFSDEEIVRQGEGRRLKPRRS